VNKYEKTFRRILQTYIEQEKSFKESDPSLGDAAYDVLMKRTKGRLIDKFLSCKVTYVKVDSLVKTHRGPFYSPQAMLWKIDDDEPIQVIRHKGKNLLMDGHHRVLIHKIIGKNKISAYVIDLDKKRKRKK
jgi:hypothetical protein